MKKYLFTMATAAMLFASCSSDDTVVVDNGANEEGLVEIKLGTRAKVGARALASEIKDLAALTEGVGIIALDRTVSAWSDGNTSVILNNVTGKATGTAPNYDITLVPKTEGAKYYYPDATTPRYDFYGYYPKADALDFTNGVTAAGNFTKELDILAGIAPMVADSHKDYAWSAEYYRLHRSDNLASHPNIEFNHMNSRFVVKIVQGETFNAASCTIKDITMYLPETYTLAFNNGVSIEYGQASQTATSVKTETSGEIVAPEGTASEVADFMVPSGYETHTFYVNFIGRDEPTPVEVVFNEKVFEDVDTDVDTKFEPGKIYTITLTINGPEEIVVKATLKAWEPGGDFNFGI